MEILIPALALGGLYKVSNQYKKSKQGGSQEHFDNRQARLHAELLPNMDVPNRNFPEEYPVMNAEADLTSKLSTVNGFDQPHVYTDRYFNADMNASTVNNVLDNNRTRTGLQYKSLTGANVDIDSFRHNNMVPFFGSKSHANNAPNALESTLDNYTGSGSQHISKVEQAPLFSPNENYQWAYGMPGTTDFVQSRINPSMNMANVKPFEQIQVAPGLGLGFTSEGVGGYNSGMFAREQWMDRGVDQLRAASNPKASGLGMYGFEGPANSHIKAAPAPENIGAFERHHVTKTFEMGQDRLFTTTGVEKGAMLHAIPIKKNVQRSTTESEYTGVAGGLNTKEMIRGEYMEPHGVQLGPVPIAGAFAPNYGGGNEADFGAKSVKAYPNNRSVPRSTDDLGYFGAVKNTLGAAVAPFVDMLRPSRKENMVGTLRPYHNPKSSVESSYVFNPSDTAPVTIRQTTENSKFHLNVNANQHGGAYQSTPHQPVHNERDTTTDYYYMGNASAGDGTHHPRTYDAEYNQRNNDIKASTIQGRMTPGNMALMNNSVNMRARPQEHMLKNDRPVVGSFYSATPSIQNLGELQGSPSTDLYQGQQLDRNNGDIMSQLKGNPYTQNMFNGL